MFRRRHATPLEHHLVDEFDAGRLTRRQLLRRLSAIGAGVALASGWPRSSHSQERTGAVIRLSAHAPAGSIDPLRSNDATSILLLTQVAEFLVTNWPEGLRPSLAESWSPNDDGSVWTFRLRRGVLFHSGQPLTAGDVVATMDRLTDPASGSGGATLFRGTLSKGGTQRRDDYTVEFHLDRPNASFPYYVSSDHINAAILPGGNGGNFQSGLVGSGPFRLQRYRANQGVVLTRNPQWWGGAVLPERIEVSFHPSEPSQTLAMLSGDVDLAFVSAFATQPLLKDRRFRIERLPSSAHFQLHMRNDVAPFNDRRVRKAFALAIDRPRLIGLLYRGFAELGNDAPLAPALSVTDASVEQRGRNLEKARALFQAAGVKSLPFPLVAPRWLEIPNYAVLVQSALREAGVDLSLRIDALEKYYGSAKFGTSPWLDSPLAITDYASRGFPDVYLGAALSSTGIWNAARFHNEEFDRLFVQYQRTLDLQSQRVIARDMQQLLLAETPLVVPFFRNVLMPIDARLRDVEANPFGWVSLARAWRA
ncbi:MAG TPA: ABC transporter substrate-binding protein [Steroidobacter sp.]|nr:ABC transporter substrate-binding protein [Steroidobacter sp.]